MDIAPVGVQMTYANATNASNVQHNLNHAAAVQQANEADRQDKDVDLKQKQVRNREDAEGGTIKDDPERRSRGGGYYYRGSKKKNDDEEEKKPREKLAVDPKRGRFLDISF